MTLLVFTAYATGMLVLLLGAACSLSYLRESPNNAELLNGAYRLTTIAAGLLVAMALLRTIQWQQVPFTTPTDSLSLLVMFSLLAIVIQLGSDPSQRALLCFYLPPLSLIGALSGVAAWPALAQPPRPLSDALLTAHVGLVFLALALFVVAGLNSVAYAFQAHRLKHRNTTGIFQKLPSLETLDRNLFRLVKIGYPTYTATLIVGGFWVWYEGQNLSPTWWLSPKIFMAFAMLGFYAFTFHARAAGRLRGAKLAHIVCGGTGILLSVYVTLALLRVLNYNFYGDAG